MVEVSVKNLTVNFVNKKVSVTVLDGLSAVFPSGSFNVIAGYSGCGKTTLLRAVAGLIDYEGEVCFDGEAMEEVPTQKRNLAYVSQQYVLYSNRTIFDNIAFPLKLKGAEVSEINSAVKDIAEKLGLTCCLTRRPKHISGGQQQRAAIARALVKRPSVCLMDEPLSNIDQQMRNTVRVQIKQALKSIGCTVIYVTHDFKEALALADNLFILNGGKIVFSGTPSEALKSNAEIVKSLRGTEDDIW